MIWGRYLRHQPLYREPTIDDAKSVAIVDSHRQQCGTPKIRSRAETASFTQVTKQQTIESKAVIADATDTVAKLVKEVENTSTSIAQIDKDTINGTQ